MRSYSISEARKNLSRLVESAANGEPFVIAKAGKQLVKVIAIQANNAQASMRVGFLAGQISVPADFDQMGEGEIQEMFGLGPAVDKTTGNP